MLSISYSAVSRKKYRGSSEHMMLPVRNTGGVRNTGPVRNTGGVGLVDSGKATGSGQVSKDQLVKLNELAKHRPFNILYKVKRYDPL
jgi:hypothetical protein